MHQLSKRLDWLLSASCAAAGIAVLAACATMPESGLPSPKPWSSLNDCFRRDVALSPDQLSAMARDCASAQAAGDPRRTSVDRASAAFNAAAALNQIANRSDTEPNCRNSADCYELSLRLLDQSDAHQRDDQIDIVAGGKASDRFRVARRLERARAFYGLARADEGERSCGGTTNCLSRASATLEGVDLELSQRDETEDGDALVCELLDVRSRVNGARGAVVVHKTRADLREMSRLCPDRRSAAVDHLAELSFEDAETLRREFLGVHSSVSAGIGVGMRAVASYQDSMVVERFKERALNASGLTLRETARRDPEQARVRLAEAADAFRDLAALATRQGNVQGEAHAQSQLGQTLRMRVRIEAYNWQTERRALLRQAETAFARAHSLGGDAKDLLRLAETRVDLNALDAAKSDYRAAIQDLRGVDRAQARVALATVLETLGERSEALEALELALAERPNDPATAYKFARLTFDAGRVQDAAPLLRSVVDRLEPPVFADAHYLLSVADMLDGDPGWRERAVAHAEQAVRAGDGRAQYARQACLAHIQSDEDDVKTGASITWCEGIAGAEGDLLLGMYLLKQAQSQDVSAYSQTSQSRWRAVLNDAEAAFRNGQRELALSPPKRRTVYFDDLGRNVELAAELDRGLAVIRRCRRDSVIEPTDPQWAALETFFGRYGVLRCS